MSLHVTCGVTAHTGVAPQGLPLEQAAGLDWSETLAAAGTTTNSVPTGQQLRVLTIVAEVRMWVAFGPSPNASLHPRRLFLPGREKSFLAPPGTRVAWVAA